MKIFGFDPFNAPVRKRKVSLERARLAKELFYDAYGDRDGICGVGVGVDQPVYYVKVYTDKTLNFILPESINGVEIKTEVDGTIIFY
jgi:hypothetical protein